LACVDNIDLAHNDPPYQNYIHKDGIARVIWEDMGFIPPPRQSGARGSGITLWVLQLLCSASKLRVGPAQLVGCIAEQGQVSYLYKGQIASINVQHARRNRLWHSSKIDRALQWVQDMLLLVINSLSLSIILALSTSLPLSIDFKARFNQMLLRNVKHTQLEQAGSLQQLSCSHSKPSRHICQTQSTLATSTQKSCCSLSLTLHTNEALVSCYSILKTTPKFQPISLR
jgi:hypothetical protein